MTEEKVWRRLYPFDSNYVRLGGPRCHYLDEGPRDAAETLLLVHGNPTWSFYWRRVVAALAGRFRVVAPDHIGCGLSDKPQHYQYTLAQHIANLASLVEQLDLARVTLVGHDWGGAIGLGAAARLRNRFGRLVLMNTAAFRTRRMPLRIRLCRLPGVGPWAVRRLGLFSRAALRMATAQARPLARDVKAGYLAPYDSSAKRIAIARFVEDIPLRVSHPSYAMLCEVEEGLARFRDTPVALIWGMRDWCFTPYFLERFELFFPQAEVTRCEDAGHWVVEDAGDEVIAALERFITTTRPAKRNAETAGTAIERR